MPLISSLQIINIRRNSNHPLKDRRENSHYATNCISIKIRSLNRIIQRALCRIKLKVI